MSIPGRAAPPVVLLGGRVFTADRRRPWADAVAFDGSGILAVGTTEEVRGGAPTTEAIDVGGRTIVPGFVPEPWGKIPRYVPSWVEITVSAGLWALGAFVFTVLAKAAIPIELGHMASRPAGGDGLLHP